MPWPEPKISKLHAVKNCYVLVEPSDQPPAPSSEFFCTSKDGPSEVLPFMEKLVEDNINAVVDRTGYMLEVRTGLRKYGPPRNWQGPKPLQCSVS